MQRLGENITVRILLHTSSRKIPGRTTILEHINLIDEKVTLSIAQQQLKWLEKQDRSSNQWERVVVDSTAVKANASHPVDSALLVENLHGLFREHERMRQILGQQKELSCKVNRWLKDVENELMGKYSKKKETNPKGIS